KSKYGYPGSGDITATYYNDSDLGVGREMHCWQYTRTAGAQTLTGAACFVSNYSDTWQTGKFGNNNVASTMTNAIHHTGLNGAGFAPVAMVREKPAGSSPPGAVNFVVYNPAGNRQDTAKLDNTGAHVSIPNNCLTCHGVESFFDPGSNTISARANFLPF